jgi:hypothetical protein
MKGIRVQPNERGILSARDMQQPGAYGRATHQYVAVFERTGWWNVTCPDGTSCSLNPRVHTVTEHEDGTITVHPSIDLSDLPWNGFHGWLKRGVWTQA